MQYENTMDFNKIKIICHGARALRIGQRLIRKLWTYIKSADFKNGNASKEEREEIFNSISLNGVLSYPDDIENISTDGYVIFQIIMSDDEMEKITLVNKKSKGKTGTTFVIGKQEAGIADTVCVEEKELFNAFLEKIFE